MPVLKRGVARSPEEAAEVAKKLGGTVVVKAQIHAGGRGKAGGVKVVPSPEKAAEFAKGLLGMTLVTHQTGPDGRVVRQVLIESGCDIARELYLGVVVDRATGRSSVIASPEGGIEIEEVAAKTPGQDPPRDDRPDDRLRAVSRRDGSRSAWASRRSSSTRRSRSSPR